MNEIESWFELGGQSFGSSSTRKVQMMHSDKNYRLADGASNEAL
jgi:hypothetical protein